MIAVLAALKEEIRGLQKRMPIIKSLAYQDCFVWEGNYRGKDLLLAQTGIGRRRAQAAASFILDNYPLEAVISLGFAAGISPELKAGDIVICPTVYRGDSQSEAICFSDAHLLQAATKAMRGKSIRLFHGSGVTVSRILGSSGDKRATATAFSANVADMESYWVGRVAAEKGVPFLAVRAVSDAIEDNLPHLELLIDLSGNWHKKKATFYFLCHPQEAIKLPRLYFNSKRAGKSLDIFVESFLGEGMQ